MGRKSNWKILEDCAPTTMRHLIIAFVFPAGNCLCSCLPLVSVGKNKRFGTDGISLCLDSFQNAISSLMAVVHVIRNKEEPPLLRFRGINGNVQSACSNVLLA